jgi:uncharacterized protein YndB with AHSA1/START domain
LTIVRLFDAPIEQVFRAWTDPQLLARWWGPQGVTNPVCKLDVKPGGSIEIVMLAGEAMGSLKGSKWPMTGVYQEIIPPSKLVYRASAIMEGKPIIESLNTVTFEEVEGKTKITLDVQVTRTAPGAEGPLSGMAIGWNQSVDKLAQLVKRQERS